MMEKLLKTSVIIATKNNVGTIQRCLLSLMPFYNQGYIHEILVVDGYSTDGTREIINNFPVKLLFDNGTTYAEARETGWRNSTGEIIMFLDSDAYLESNFFPDLFEYFSDKEVGIIGCHAKCVVTNKISKVIAEEWRWTEKMIKPSKSLLMKIYVRINSGKQELPPGGPCQIVRRTCLQEVQGFPRYKHQEDIYLSERIIDLGWNTQWWIDAPLYHYPRNTLKGLMKQGYKWGNDYMIGQAAGFKSLKSNSSTLDLFSVFGRLGSPLVGMILAWHYKDALHLIVYPLPRYAWVTGYVKAKLHHRKIDIGSGNTST